MENIPHAEAGAKTREIAAKEAGFGNETTFRQAKTVVDSGIPELVRKMDTGEVSILRSAAESVITVGQALIRQKAKLPHGMFLPWIESEFGMSDQSARRFMHVADVYGSKSNIVLNMDATAIYELSAPKTPQEIRDRVEEMIIDGEKVTAAKELPENIPYAEAGAPTQRCINDPTLHQNSAKQCINALKRIDFLS